VDEGSGTVAVRGGNGSPYVFSDSIILAVNVALSIRRPLLVYGEPGSGKSTLAASVASIKRWRPYKAVITSRTQARDLQWRYDPLRRLADANVGKDELKPMPDYIEPMELWWAFDPKSAARRGGTPAEVPDDRLAQDPAGRRAGAASQGRPGRTSDDAVVLVDEIDKADPDVPNDLLEALDLQRFTVEETGYVVEQRTHQVLVIITTNRERELPPAFVRRCVCLTLPPPTEDWLVRVARQHVPDVRAKLAREIAARVMTLREEASRIGLRQPSTAEYLDALRACLDLKIGLKSDAWKGAVAGLLWKHEREAGLPKEES
jgi:MoxR-like ATPase